MIHEIDVDSSSSPPVPRAVEIGFNITTFRALWNQRRWIAKVVLVSVALTALGSLLIPNDYESTTRLMPPDPQSASSTLMLAALAGRTQGLTGIAGDLLGIKSTGALFVSILGSETVQDDLINKFDLRKVYHKKYYVDARKKLTANTSIVEDRKSGIITVTVTDHDPQRARALARAYVDELNGLVTSVSTSAARREREFLEQRLGEVKIELDAASRDLAQFSSKNIALDPQQQGRAMVDAAAQLQGQLIAAQAEQRALSSIYTENNVRVRAIAGKISELKKQLANLSGTTATDQISDNLGYPTLRQLPVLGVTYLDLYRRAKILEVVFETLTSQFEIAKVQEAKETPSVKVLDPGNLPERKSAPSRSIIVFVAAMLATFAAAGWILSRIVWDNMSPSNARKRFATEVYADVHRMLLRQLKWKRDRISFDRLDGNGPV